MKTTFILVGFLLAILRFNCEAAQPAPPLDFSPQEIPIPTARIAGANPTNAFTTVITCLTTNGFEVFKSDPRQFTAEMRKKVSGRAKGYDRVVVWFDRDAAKPNVLKAYILFGRYFEAFGTGGKMGRQVLDRSDEEEVTSPWRPQLLEALENLGE